MRVFWFEVRDHTKRRPWRVYLVSDRIPDLNGRPSIGMTYPRKREIDVFAGSPYRKLCDTLSHEFVHAAMGDVKQDDHERAAEEKIAAGSERGLFALWVGLGARLPPLPKEFAQLRKRSR